MHCSLKYYSMFENLFKHWSTFNNNNNRDESETKVELYVSLKKEGKKKRINYITQVCWIRLFLEWRKLANDSVSAYPLQKNNYEVKGLSVTHLHRVVGIFIYLPLFLRVCLFLFTYIRLEIQFLKSRSTLSRQPVALYVAWIVTDPTLKEHLVI